MNQSLFIEELFPRDVKFPAGFQYYPNFLSVQEETTLLASVSQLSLTPMLFQGFEAKRKVASFGYDYSFEKRSLSKGEPIPVQFQWLLDKTSMHLRMQQTFTELLVTEYPPGAVINWHRDAPPFGIIVGISLLSPCVFRFRPFDKRKQNRKSIISIPLERRSLYVMADESREAWQHSIMPVRTPRYSITLRTLR